ncbi:MAG: glutaredoxin domain-containing protein [Neptuniibacter sp.]
MKSFVAILLIMLSGNTYSEIYKWVDESGKLHFSDKKPDTSEFSRVDINVNSYTGVTYSLPPPSSDSAPKGKVVMYSTSWCGYCKKARAYFKKNNIAYIEYDIEKDYRAKDRYKKLNATGVPVIIFGDRRMNGFNEKGFERIYI